MKVWSLVMVYISQSTAKLQEENVWAERPREVKTKAVRSVERRQCVRVVP